MLNFLRQLDIVSRLVIVTTFVLFIVALVIKGFGHGLLLEAGVFLVSVKLIMMAAKNVFLAKAFLHLLTPMKMAVLSR